MPISARSRDVAGAGRWKFEIDMKLGPNTSSGDTTLKTNAAITNFTAERLIGNEKLEGATLNVDRGSFRPENERTGHVVRRSCHNRHGPSTGKPAEASIGLTLDDADAHQARFWFRSGIERRDRRQNHRSDRDRRKTESASRSRFERRRDRYVRNFKTRRTSGKDHICAGR